MREVVLRLLPYVLPPVLGAIIGYVTNYFAIRMLFRPLAEKRIFGIRVPFTPGIIPRQRYQLSESIAKMVSTKLLTPDALAGKLNDPEFAESLTGSVARFTSEMLDRKPGDDRDRDSAGELSGMISVVFQGFLSSDVFRDSARRIVMAAIDGALKLTVDQVAPKETTVRHIVENSLGAISGGVAANAIREAVVRWVSTHVAENTPLHEVLGPRTLERLGDLLPNSYKPILESLLTFLRQPDTRNELAVHGRELMQRILKRLSLFQRLVVSATQYDRNLIENMPAIVSDVIESLDHAGRNPDNMARIVGVFRSKLVEWGETGIGTLGESLSLDLPELADRGVTAGLELLGRQDVLDRVTGSILEFLDRRGDDTLQTALEETLGVANESLKDRAVALVDKWIGRPDASAGIADQVSSFVATHLLGSRTTALRSLVPISSEQKNKVDAVIAGKLREQLELRVPELIEGLDVHGMVVQKIDGLDVESVEQLLLMVIARHLKWINLFGALLGALIGGIQVLLSTFT